MSKTKKTLAIVIAFALVFGIAVGGTIAYLTSKSETVTNTFTVGKIKIRLEEHDDGTANGTVVTARDGIKILPGDTVPKDPFVTVEAKSEDCYVYVHVINYLAFDPNNNAATLNINSSAWELVKVKENDMEESGVFNAVYRYKGSKANADGAVPYAESETVLEPLFETVTISSALDQTKLDKLEGKTIVLQAYAHQAANVDVEVADAAAVAWGLPGNNGQA